MASNKKLGNKFEAELSQILFDHGFWVHRLQQSAAGQPADIIAVKDGKPFLIDCKVCSTKEGFRLSRVEENQELAMSLWESCGNGTGWFALKVQSGEIYMISMSGIEKFRVVEMSINEKTMQDYCIALNDWIVFYGN